MGKHSLSLLRWTRSRLSCLLLQWGGLAFCCAALSSFSQENAPVDTPFRDEPEARALYKKMVDTMRKATTLSWVSDYRSEFEGLRWAT